MDFAVGLGQEDSPEKRRSSLRWTHYYWAQSAELLQDLETYGGQEETFWINYARRHLVSFGCANELSESLARQVHLSMREQYKPQDLVFPDVPGTLKTLKDAGFILGVVSNRNKSYLEQLKALELDQYFSCWIAAGEISSWKPEPGIFQHALQKLELKPSETVYVGDNYYADVIGAQRANILPVLIDPEQVFPDAGCDVIQTFGGLLEVLDQ